MTLYDISPLRGLFVEQQETRLKIVDNLVHEVEINTTSTRRRISQCRDSNEGSTTFGTGEASGLFLELTRRFVIRKQSITQ